MYARVCVRVCVLVGVVRVVDVHARFLKGVGEEKGGEGRVGVGGLGEARR